MSKPKIVCAGMCDTKGPEIRYLAQMVAKHGGEPLVMDLSLGGAVDWADIPLLETLATTGTSVDEVHAAPRATAIDLVGRAGGLKALELHHEGRLDGIISWAGAVGTTTATMVMRALPFGVPKIMLTDMASSDVSEWLGNKDIYIVNPTAEQGINVVTHKAIENAAAGIVAMARVPEIPAGEKPLCAITAYGTTTPTVLRCQAAMQARGWDTAIFHAVGVGATMEDLIRSGLITALIDLTTAELMSALIGSPYGVPKAWQGERLTAAGATGIPQVVAPGGLDQCTFGALRTVPRSFLDEIACGRRRSHRGSGEPYRHADGVTLLAPTLDEVEQVAVEIATKLNATTGPTAFFLPMRGWSAYDQAEELASRARGWAEGNGDGPFWEPDPDVPRWSRRATLMRSVLAERFDRSNECLDLVVTDMHILDPAFGDLVARCLGDMLDGRWRTGLYAHEPGVLAGEPVTA